MDQGRALHFQCPPPQELDARSLNAILYPRLGKIRAIHRLGWTMTKALLDRQHPLLAIWSHNTLRLAGTLTGKVEPSQNEKRGRNSSPGPRHTSSESIQAGLKEEEALAPFLATLALSCLPAWQASTIPLRTSLAPSFFPWVFVCGSLLLLEAPKTTVLTVCGPGG